MRNGRTAGGSKREALAKNVIIILLTSAWGHLSTSKIPFIKDSTPLLISKISGGTPSRVFLVIVHVLFLSILIPTERSPKRKESCAKATGLAQCSHRKPSTHESPRDVLTWVCGGGEPWTSASVGALQDIMRFGDEEWR